MAGLASGLVSPGQTQVNQASGGGQACGQGSSSSPGAMPLHYGLGAAGFAGGGAYHGVHHSAHHGARHSLAHGAPHGLAGLGHPLGAVVPGEPGVAGATAGPPEGHDPAGPMALPPTGVLNRHLMSQYVAVCLMIVLLGCV